MNKYVFLRAPDSRRIFGPALALTAVLAVGACAGTPEPVAEMASARTAVRSVQDTDAQRLAPVRLDRAKSKLKRAEAAMKAKEYDEARRLAEESLADAQLARAEADAIVAERNAEELENSISVLRSEIERVRATN